MGGDAETEAGRTSASQSPDEAEQDADSSSPDNPADGDAGKPERKRPTTDIQAILTVFERRSDDRNIWERTQKLRLDLRHADLRGAILIFVRLQRADLTNVDLTNADLTDADLMAADLRGASLWNADLRGVDLTSANLRGANLTRGDLTCASLTSADLARAKFSKNPSELGAAWDDAYPPSNLDSIEIDAN